jgi:hypothetical protein
MIVVISELLFVIAGRNDEAIANYARRLCIVRDWRAALAMTWKENQRPFCIAS